MANKNKSPFISFLSAVMFTVFGRRRRKANAEDFKRVDFSSSTQRLGIYFTDKIRDVFRFKWIKPGS